MKLHRCLKAAVAVPQKHAHRTGRTHRLVSRAGQNTVAIRDCEVEFAVPIKVARHDTVESGSPVG